MQLIYNGADPSAPGTDAGSHRIDALLGGPDGDLGPGAGLPGNVPDLYQPVGNLRHLQLKQAADQIGMGPGDKNLRSTVGTVYVYHIDPDQVAFLIHFPGNLLAGAQNGVGPVGAGAPPGAQKPPGGVL